MKILLIALLLNIPSAILCGCLMPKGELEPLHYVNKEGQVKHIVFQKGLEIVGEIK